MRKLILIIAISISVSLYALPASNGATGILEFPDAYNLRANNYTVAASINGIDKSTAVQLMIEGGFIPQLEAGIVLSSKDTMINESLLKANIKFQFVKEADNPALALGFIETKDIAGKEDVYGYLAASKKLGVLFVENAPIAFTGGIKYNKIKDTDVFIGIDMPIFSVVKLLGEVYTYHEKEVIVINGRTETDNKLKYSFNIGGEFYTYQSIRTKVWWKDIDNTVGLTIAYIGIYK